MINNQAVLSGRQPLDMLSINIGWAAGVILGILSSAAVSGKLNKDLKK